MRETILSFVEDAARRGDETAIAHQRGLRVYRWSYEKLAATAKRFARELEARDVQKGDRVLFWSENSPEWVAAFFGCLLRGAIVVPLDSRNTGDFVTRVHSQVAAKLALLGSPGSVDFDANLQRIKLDDIESVVAHQSDATYRNGGAGAADLVEIIFTSGTTAEPKGVCLTHGNLVANLAPLEREIQKYLKWERYFHPLRFLNLVPLSHVFGQFMGIFVPQLVGGEVFFQESHNPSEIIETVKRERISVVVAVPRQLETLRDRIERDFSARGKNQWLRKTIAEAEGMKFLKRWWVFRKIHRRLGWKFWAFVSGGATLDPETENFWRRLGYAVVQGYGMTETASLVSINHPFKISRGSIGKAMPGQEVKIDESGEILVRGANVSPGYWSGSSKTVAVVGGWLRTGDVGERDEAGNLYFRGRKKDVIVTAAGLNIYPEDLEAELARQPEVREAIIVGWEGTRGPEPVAVLILSDDCADAKEVVEQANRRLSDYQQIRRWFIWPDMDFPRTPTTQKVLKRAVLERMKEERSNATSEPSSFIHHTSSFMQAVAGISGQSVDQLNPSANLTTDLKLDSLGRVELLSALEERFQVELDETAFTAATTLGDIENMIAKGEQTDESLRGGAGYPYPEWAGRAPATWIRFLCFYLIVLPASRGLSWTKVRGRENLAGLGGPALFISNHVTMVDHGLILTSLPAKFGRRLAVAMEGERLREWRHPSAVENLFARLWLRVLYVLVVTLFNVFALPQRSGFRRSFAYAGEKVDRGYSILVFPEGRTTPDGLMKPFMGGIGLLASELGVPVVPVKIEGLYEIKQKRRYFARPGEITVTFGEPVRFSGDDDPARIARDLQSRVERLNGR
jgi:long-chain acyl-CoA synthetase